MIIIVFIGGRIVFVLGIFLRIVGVDNVSDDKLSIALVHHLDIRVWLASFRLTLLLTVRFRVRRVTARFRLTVTLIAFRLRLFAGWCFDDGFGFGAATSWDNNRLRWLRLDS